MASGRHTRFKRRSSPRLSAFNGAGLERLALHSQVRQGTPILGPGWSRLAPLRVGLLAGPGLQTQEKDAEACFAFGAFILGRDASGRLLYFIGKRYQLASPFCGNPLSLLFVSVRNVELDHLGHCHPPIRRQAPKRPFFTASGRLLMPLQD